MNPEIAIGNDAPRCSFCEAPMTQTVPSTFDWQCEKCGVLRRVDPGTESYLGKTLAEALAEGRAELERQDRAEQKRKKAQSVQKRQEGTKALMWAMTELALKVTSSDIAFDGGNQAYVVTEVTTGVGMMTLRLMLAPNDSYNLEVHRRCELCQQWWIHIGSVRMSVSVYGKKIDADPVLISRSRVQCWANLARIIDLPVGKCLCQS